MRPGTADLSVMAAAGRRQAVDVDGVMMSALVAEARQAKAVVVALHGGATTSAYFDCAPRPRLSLLRAGAALGYTVIALDRPGYGASADIAEELTSPGRRVDLAHSAVERLLTTRSRGAGVFLIGHSTGCELAVRMACDERGSDLLGVELAGTGTQHHPDATDTMAEALRDEPPRNEPPRNEPPRDGSSPTGSRLRRLIWHDDHIYPADVVGGRDIAAVTPAYEGAVVRRWAPVDFPALAARVRVPVHFTLGDHERVWRNGPAALADIAGMFTAAPRVVVNEQADSGHNLSLGHSAMAYHLTVLSFVEECLLAREHTTTTNGRVP